MITCTNCGKQNPSRQILCQSCGQPLSPGAQASPSAHGQAPAAHDPNKAAVATSASHALAPPYGHATPYGQPQDQSPAPPQYPTNTPGLRRQSVSQNQPQYQPPPVMTNRDPQSTGQWQQAPQSTYAPTQNTRSNQWVLIGAALVVVMVLLAVVVWLMWPKNPARPNIVGVWDMVSGADFIGYGGTVGKKYQITEDGKINLIYNPEPNGPNHSFTYVWIDDQHITVTQPDLSSLNFSYQVNVKDDTLIVQGVQLPYTTVFQRSTLDARMAIPTPSIQSMDPAATEFAQGMSDADLFGLSMTSSTEGWAIGNSNNQYGGALFHYHDGKWSISGDRPLGGATISMISPSEGWMLGNGLRYHFKDGRWNQDGNSGGLINRVQMLSATEGWAVGYNTEGTNNQLKAVIEHFSGGQWQSVDTPSDWPPLYDVALTSSDDGWAVGDQGTILHYSGGAWQRAPRSGDWSALLSDVPFRSISMVSASEGWVFGGPGQIPNSSQQSGVIMHYKDGTWQWVRTPVVAPILSAQMLSTSEGWAVGGWGTGYSNQGETDNPEGTVTILHFKDGQWQPVDSPTRATLNAVQIVSADEGWAVGYKGTILHYKDGRWSSDRP